MTDTISNLNRKFSQKSVKENVHFITANQLETLKLGKSFREGSDKTILLTLSNRQNVHTLSTDEMGKIYFLTDENGIQNLYRSSINETGFDTLRTITNLEYSLSNYVVEKKFYTSRFYNK